MIRKLAAVLLFSWPALLPPAARCAWENIRYSDAPLAVVYASTGAYEVAYTAGEDCASPSELVSSPVSAWSGYLSLVPANMVNQGVVGFVSTSSVALDGALWGNPPGNSVQLLFGEDLAPSLSAPAVNVTRVYDNTGGVVNSSWAVTFGYSGRQLIISPSADWPKGSVFSVYISSSIVDITGSPVSEAATVYFSVLMDYQTDNTAAAFSDRRVRVAVPANAYSQDFYLTLSTDSGRREVAEANARLAALPGAPEFLNTVDVRPYDPAGNPVQPGAPCVVTLPYPDDDGNGVIDGSVSRLKASNLAVWHLDEQRGLWVKQTGASLDASSRLVSQPVSHFSNYALLALPDADVTPVYAFPVPFRPNAGNAARYGSWSDLITFTNLPVQGKIRIYTVTGALVRELAVTPPSMKWDVKNKDGELVGSGVYLWEVTSGKNRKTGKLVVIK
ncbi:MAG: T9SS type A sorting domain-containing protein [Elusimicrobia bacterium]|nr:T9SS type A sorting domain-containing protein [Elusimicrobiota bacterium]